MIYLFEQFIIDTGQYQLSFFGKPVPVEPLVFDLLIYLIENRNRVVGRDELLENLWQGKVVTDSALAARLKDARKALGDSGDRQKIIKTVHGRGYQFIADVTEAKDGHSSEKPESWTPGDEFPLPDAPSIAVLPFTNMSGDPEQEYFSDGITEDIITALSRIPSLFVVARHSTSVYKGQAVDVRKVGKEQGVKFVLEGSVRSSGSRLRITAQLIDANTGDHRWADRYDRELNDVFEVQDEITKNVTVAVQVELTAGEQALIWAGGTDNLEAWECVIRGNELMHRHSRGDNIEARRLAEHARTLDPDYANAWVLIGMTYFEDAMWGWSSSHDPSISQALEAATKSIELQDLNPDGYMCLACAKFESSEFDEAVEAARKGVSLSPNHAPNVALFSAVLGRAGRYQEADQQIRRAIRLSPVYPSWYLYILGISCFALDNDEEAINLFQAFLESAEPDSSFLPYSRVWLAVCLMNAGHVAEAKTVRDEIYRLDPDYRIEDWWQFPRKDQTVRDRAVKIWGEIVAF